MFVFAMFMFFALGVMIAAMFIDSLLNLARELRAVVLAGIGIGLAWAVDFNLWSLWHLHARRQWLAVTLRAFPCRRRVLLACAPRVLLRPAPQVPRRSRHLGEDPTDLRPRGRAAATPELATHPATRRLTRQQQQEMAGWRSHRARAPGLWSVTAPPFIVNSSGCGCRVTGWPSYKGCSVAPHIRRRTSYRTSELDQFDPWESDRVIPLGFGQDVGDREWVSAKRCSPSPSPRRRNGLGADALRPSGGPRR
jgi:hypothetical protein